MQWSVFCYTVSAFPAWKPGGQRPMCAKFANYYEVECWDPIMQKLNYNFTTKSLRGKHKLQRKSKLKLSKVLSFTCCSITIWYQHHIKSFWLHFVFRCLSWIGIWSNVLFEIFQRKMWPTYFQRGKTIVHCWIHRCINFQ